MSRPYKKRSLRERPSFRGSASEILGYHIQEGFSELYQININRGNAKIRNYLARNPSTGKFRYLSPNLGADDRSAQVLEQIQLFSGDLPFFAFST